ncbi:MAG: hypothetical protein AAF193_05820, partial [Bacteroidota bacterium]
MKQLYLIALLVLGASLTTYAQKSCIHGVHGEGKCPGIMGLPYDIDAFTPPPAEFNYGGERAVIINVNYNGFTPQAQTAFQYAVDIWASLLTSDVPIQVDATWEDIEGTVLGFAGANGFYPGVAGQDPDVYYPAALADKLSGFNLAPGQPDITASFDSGTNWYFGLDGNTPAGQFDFVSVVLHELGHGLGIIGSGNVNGSTGFIGFLSSYSPAVYDTFVEDNNGMDILDYGDGTTALGNALTNNNQYWFGSSGIAGANGGDPRLYVPFEWNQGSSYSHLDEDTYNPGNSNSLMTPFIAPSEAIHDPGPIVMGMMEDMGWTTDNSGGGCDGLAYQIVLDTDCYGTETT